MSDVLDWIAFSAWSAAVGVQIGAAVYDFWKGRRAITGYDEVRNGKMVNGRRMMLPISPKRNDWNVFCPLDQADNDESELSVLMLFNDRTCSVVRQSLIFPSASDTICRFVCDRDEWPTALVSSNRVASRISAVVFQHRSHRRCRLVLFDTISKRQSFSIDTQAAEGDQYILYQCPLMVHGYDAARARINVVFLTRSQAIGNVANSVHAGEYYNFYDCSYEFPVSSGDQAAVVEATSWESLSIPSNDRIFCFSCVNPEVAILDRQGVYDIDNHLAISFDRKNMWRVETIRRWLGRIRSTTHGAKYLDSMESLASLSLPLSESAQKEVPFVRHLYAAPRFHFGGALLSECTSGVLQRWINLLR